MEALQAALVKAECAVSEAGVRVLQAAGLGLDVASVFVAHPIQDRTDEEMTALADGAIDALVAAITGPG